MWRRWCVVSWNCTVWTPVCCLRGDIRKENAKSTIRLCESNIGGSFSFLHATFKIRSSTPSKFRSLGESEKSMAKPIWCVHIRAIAPTLRVVVGLRCGGVAPNSDAGSALKPATFHLKKAVHSAGWVHSSAPFDCIQTPCK